MGEREVAENFKQALQTVEQSGDVSGLVSLFAEDAVLSRQGKRAEEHGQAATREFWQNYLASFQHIQSRFTSTLIAEGLIVLEWQSEGSLMTGKAVSYCGISVLLLDPAGLVKDFRTYFDSAALEQHQS